jgi:alkylation response protein AidB-like acyl-CoA dehydrogenase/SAM-dependent methyltransferase
MPDPTERAAWAEYLAAYHDSNPGITEDVLADARDAEGRSPYDWLIEAVPDGAMVVDLACGSGPLLQRLGGRAVVGIDRSAGELARARAARPETPAVRADAAALPLAAGVADVVAVSMALMLMHPLDLVLAEAARVLRPGGLLVATLPSRTVPDGATPAVRQFADIVAELDPGNGYPNPLEGCSLPAQFVDAGFELTDVSHAEFVRRLENAADAEVMVRSFYAPGAAEEQVVAVVDRLRRRVASAPVDVGYRLRRLVAVSTGAVPVPVRAGRVAATVRGQAAGIEAAGRLPDALVSAMREGGLFDMWRPKELGGAELGPEEALAAIETVAAGDGSTAWCLAVSVGTGALAAYLPEVGAREIFGKGPTITAGSFNPAGRATLEADSLRVSGRWAFGSGSRHCDWLCGGALVVDASGEPVVLDDGRPDARLAFFPVDRATIHDTWHVTGLRATGSHDYEVEALDVPLAHTMPFAFRPWAAGDLWRMPPMSIFFAPMAAVSLGIARAAIDELVALAADKTPYRSSRRLAERDVVQAMVARAEARVGSAGAFLREQIGVVWDCARRGDEATLRQRAMVRLAIVHASQSAMEAVDLCFEAAGATALYVTSPLQRQFRDVHAAGQHVVLAFSGLETVGRVLLGLDPDTSLL